MTEHLNDKVRTAVREQYATIATGAGAAHSNPGCCGPGAAASLALGYSPEDLAAVPEGANMGLGCGNPQAMATLQPGETVVDLGSGGGFDCFLAAKQVGESGRVIGVDMTPEMLSKARSNAAKLRSTNVDFRLGEIEHLPVADGTVDVVLSNCVVNLSPDKNAVFREAFRVLRPGGRLAISDVVATKTLPAALQNDVLALTGCVAGAASADILREQLAKAGFTQIRITANESSRQFIGDWLPGSGIEHFVVAATIEAMKPRDATSKSTDASCCAPICCAAETSR